MKKMIWVQKIVAVLMGILLLIGMTACGEGGQKDAIQQFYSKVEESQELLDTVADAIYDNWYDAIYNDEFGEDINVAIASAEIDHASDIDEIKALDEEIAELYKIVRDTELSAEVKAVMTAYSDYYEFVINVSGSFNSYSAEKETLKKELSSALKDLSFEL